MTSSFSLFLGGTPTRFKLDLELMQREKRTGGKDTLGNVAVDVSWSESDPWDIVTTKLKTTFREMQNSGFCERCEVVLEEEDGDVRMEIRVQTELPLLQSLMFSRLNGNSACDERYLMKTLGELDLSSVSRLMCHEGYPFFVPGVVRVEDWKSLTHLHLVNAGIVALPAALGQYVHLRELRLSQNKLTAIPREIGSLSALEVLAVDHNQLLSVPTELCDCREMQDLNLEFNNLTAVVLDLSRCPKLRSLQLYGNPLNYIPELSVCRELQSLSLMNLRVWSDDSHSQFEVTIEGTTTLAWGTKLNPLFSVIFSRSSSQHPLLAGALGRLAEFRLNCDAILELPGAPLQQLILMVLSPHGVVQEQAAKVIGLMVNDIKTADKLVKSGILGTLLSVLEADRQETRCYALKTLSVLAMTSDSTAVSLLVPPVIAKLRVLISPSSNTAVRHLALEVVGNLSFAMENKIVLLADAELKESLRALAHGSASMNDKHTRLLACRCMAILGQSEEVDAIVGRSPIKGRGVRVLSIDGGGMKGLSAVKMLKELEDRTGHHISDLFDLIGGTSTGAMLAVSLGILRFSLDQCDEIYKRLGYRVFNQAHEEDQTGWKDSLIRMYRSGQQGLRVVMAGCKHDATTFETLLQEMCRQLSDKAIGSLYIDSAVLPGPKVFAASTLTSIVPAVPFLFRNYELPVQSKDSKTSLGSCLGSSKFDLWQGVRASSAAPYFFEDFKLDGLHFQDGATTANNPTALAVQQARLLWPDKPIDCIVSIGLGAVPATQREKSSSSFIENGSVLIESSCSVERTHDAMTLMSSMTPGMQYFRFNPVDKRCDLALDDLDTEKWERLEAATADYIEKNQAQFKQAAGILMTKFHPPTSREMQETPPSKEDRALMVLSDGGELRETCRSPLHYMDYCGGTVDICRRLFAPHAGCRRERRLSCPSSLPEGPSSGCSSAYLHQVLSHLSGRVEAMHIDLETDEAGEKFIASWSSSVWSVVDSSAEATALCSVLGVHSGVSLSDALLQKPCFNYCGSRCRLISQQHLRMPLPSIVYIFERSEPNEVLCSTDVQSLGHLLGDVVITCPHRLADCFVESFLSVGVKAVCCRSQDVSQVPQDAVCFFKLFYDSLFSGYDVHKALEQSESNMPQSKNMYQLFY